MAVTADFPRSDLTGVVLAGGRATRMGGQDKGLLPLQGKPMVAHAVQRLTPQVDTLLINANRNIDQYQQYAAQVVRDDLEGFQGPLAGMLAAIAVARSDYILTVPCDSPLLAADYAARMLRELRQHKADICVASDGERLQPVFALIATALQNDLHAFLSAGERKIDRWFARHRMVQADFSDTPAMFRNINTPQELAALETELM